MAFLDKVLKAAQSFDEFPAPAPVQAAEPAGPSACHPLRNGHPTVAADHRQLSGRLESAGLHSRVLAAPQPQGETCKAHGAERLQHPTELSAFNAQGLAVAEPRRRP